MAKHYIDFEFNEGFFPNTFLGIRLPEWLSPRKHTIELISVGIVCEDGRTYSALSREYNWKNCSQWVRDNVVIPLYTSTVYGDMRNHHHASFFHKYWGKSNKQIAKEIYDFIYAEFRKDIVLTVHGQRGECFKKHNVDVRSTGYVVCPTLIGYYSAYDHVLFCSLFGTMSELPDGFPMYTVDLKQKLDEMVPTIYRTISGDYTGKLSFDDMLGYIKASKDYPKQNNEHNAVADARWNEALDKFLEKYENKAQYSNRI